MAGFENDSVGKAVEAFAQAQKECGSAEPVRYRPLLESFRHSAAVNQERAARNFRAVELLEKHPEFDDLIELLSIVPVRFIHA